MANTDRISLDILRKSINKIFDFIEKDLGISEVPLNRNYYWSVADDVLYAMGSPPKQLDVGSLKDDWDFVLSASEDPSQQIPILLVHLAPLLHALSQEVPSYKPPSSTKN